MAQQELPVQWRQDVCAVLKTGSSAVIEWTFEGEQRYDEDACEAKMLAGEVDVAYPDEVYPCFIKYLSSAQPTGCLKNMAKPPGETYDFFFEFFDQKFYGKILLRPECNRVLIFSAHFPEGPFLSCE